MRHLSVNQSFHFYSIVINELATHTPLVVLENHIKSTCTKSIYIGYRVEGGGNRYIQLFNTFTQYKYPTAISVSYLGELEFTSLRKEVALLVFSVLRR